MKILRMTLFLIEVHNLSTHFPKNSCQLFAQNEQ